MRLLCPHPVQVDRPYVIRNFRRLFLVQVDRPVDRINTGHWSVVDMSQTLQGMTRIYTLMTRIYTLMTRI